MNPVIEQNDILISTGIYHCTNWVCGWQGEIPVWLQKEFYVNYKTESGWNQVRNLQIIACCPQCKHSVLYFVTFGGKGESDGKDNSQPDSRSIDTIVWGLHGGDFISCIHREEESRYRLYREDSLLPRDDLDSNYDRDGDDVPDDLIRFFHQ